jgi:kynurenine formamidase
VISETVAALRGLRTVDLGQPFTSGMTSSPNHPGFRMALMRRHGDNVRPDGSSAANEMIVTGGHVGTHVDALAHVSYKGELHGGVDAAKAQAGGRFSSHGVDTLEPALRRGVLFDVARAEGVDVLPGGFQVGPEQLERAAAAAGFGVEDGDVALVRTGWSANFADPIAFVGHESGVPGVTEDGARWLADQGIAMTGSDTTAYEWIPPGEGHKLLPAHRLLLVERGIPIIEMLALDDLAALAPDEFLFILIPLKIVGATGSPVRPLALVVR